MAADQPDYTGNVYVTGGQVVIDTGGGPVTVQFEAPQQVEFPAAQAVNATIQGTATVQFGTAQEVFFTAAGPVNVQNDILPVTGLTYVHSVIASQTYDAGTTYYITLNAPLASYDEAWCNIFSPGGFAADIGTITVNIVYNSGFSSYAEVVGDPNNITPVLGDTVGANTVRAHYAQFGKCVGDRIRFSFTPSTTFTDSLTFDVDLHYAQITVGNPSNAPAQMQHASGQFSQPFGTGVVSVAPGPGLTTLLAPVSNGHLQDLWLSIQGNGSSVNLVDVYVASAHVDQLYVPQSGFVRVRYHWGYGVDISTAGIEMSSGTTSVAVAGGGATCAYAALAAPNIYYG